MMYYVVMIEELKLINISLITKWNMYLDFEQRSNVNVFQRLRTIDRT
jgi:hypothetical protein